MANKKNGHHPIFKKIFIPIFCLMFFQSAIFYVATVHGGVIDALNQNASDILTERVINRKNEVETQFNTKWSNMDTCIERIDAAYNTVTADSDGVIYEDTDLKKQLLSEVTPTLINTLRTNGVNGVFLILNDSKDYQSFDSDTSKEKYGICIRDYDQKSSYTDKEDLLVFRCPTSVVPDIDVSLDTGWEAVFSFDAEHNYDFYYKPLEAAYHNPDVDIDNLAYFCGNHNYMENDKTVVSYSIPLVDDSGYPYAVLGIELTTTYLKSLLPSEELNGHNEGSYALVQYDKDSTNYNVIAYDGIMFQRCFGDERSFSSSKKNSYGLLSINGNNNLKMSGSISDLTVYNKNTPFEDQKLALIGMVKSNSLAAFGISVRKKLLFVSILALIIGLLGIIIVSRLLVGPIVKLAEKVRGMNSESEIMLERIGIDEIDELLNALEEMSQNINKNQVRSEFFSRMSHDMRTPMNAIIGFSSSEILENASEEDKDEYLNKIQASGTYLLGLINEVLDMTKIDNNKLEIKETAVSINCIWEDTVPIIEEVAKRNSIKFIVKSEKDDGYMYADRQRISQIFVNLLSNAIKFSKPEGVVLFEVVTLERTEDSIVHQIRVKDSGIGMSNDFQQKLYQPFTQEHEGLVEGTGLGLSITKRLIDLMEGTITCDSVYGEGTEFTVVLTHKLAKSAEVKEKEPKTLKSEDVKNTLSGKRILLCEDHPLNMQIAVKLLEKVGVIVDTAENGVIGVEMFRKSEILYYDAILMDIRMPNMDGLEATRTIRGLKRKDAKVVTIIAMTANALAEDVRETKAAGMDEHLSKPIDPARLYGVLQKHLS